MALDTKMRKDDRIEELNLYNRIQEIRADLAMIADELQLELDAMPPQSTSKELVSKVDEELRKVNQMLANLQQMMPPWW